jgi:hypothetical protein
MGIATSFLGAAVGFHSKDVFKQFFFLCFEMYLTSQGHLMPGLWTEPIILSSSETWMHFMVTKHPGAVLFMFLDVFLLTGALILTGAQAVQVIFPPNLLVSAYSQQTLLGYQSSILFVSMLYGQIVVSCSVLLGYGE